MARWLTALLALQCRCVNTLAPQAASGEAEAVLQDWPWTGNLFRRHRPDLPNATLSSNNVTNLTSEGFPWYYKDVLPPFFPNMSSIAKDDFYLKVERWRGQVKDAQSEFGCKVPNSTEKVVYFIQQADGAPMHEGQDPRLGQLGLAQARNLAIDPMLRAALSPNLSQRATLVLASPSRRAMETALLGIRKAVPEITMEMDVDLKGMGAFDGEYDMGGAVGMLEEFNQTVLVEKYLALPARWWQRGNVGRQEQWYSFLEKLAKRPDRNVIVIGPHDVLHQADLNLHAAEVRAKALDAAGFWRDLSPPDCWNQAATTI